MQPGQCPTSRPLGEFGSLGRLGRSRNVIGGERFDRPNLNLRSGSTSQLTSVRAPGISIPLPFAGNKFCSPRLERAWVPCVSPVACDGTPIALNTKFIKRTPILVSCSRLPIVNFGGIYRMARSLCSVCANSCRPPHAAGSDHRKVAHSNRHVQYGSLSTSLPEHTSAGQTLCQNLCGKPAFFITVVFCQV